MAKALYKVYKRDTATQVKNKIYFAGEIEVDGTIFSYEVFLLPIVNKKKAEIKKIHEYLIKKVGTRLKDGKACLDITEDVVREGIETGKYSAFGFVKNLSDDAEWDDEASGTMQYYDWCKKIKGSQLWVNDLCRITEPVSAPPGAKKPSVSPLKALLKIFEEVAVKSLGSNLTHLYLLVEDHEPERTVLPGIYNKYGFSVVDIHDCNFKDYIVMRKIVNTRNISQASSQQLVSNVQSVSSLQEQQEQEQEQQSTNLTSLRTSTIPFETIHHSLLNIPNPNLTPAYLVARNNAVDGFHSIFEYPDLLSVDTLRQTSAENVETGKGLLYKNTKLHKTKKNTKQDKYKQNNNKKTRSKK